VEIFHLVTIHPYPINLSTPVRPSLSQALVLGNFMNCFEKPSFNPVFDPFSGVYGLVMGVGYI
jgi:hypothetical protein